VQASAIFQRTDSGRTEIKTKMHGLTQSERLVLIVVDGVSPYAEIRQKLKGLADERFNRALTNLLQKNLILEVLLPTGAAENDEFDAATVDRFLHQDPLDPVTIISFDVEDEFGVDIQEEGGAIPPTPPITRLGAATAQSSGSPVPASPTMTVSPMPPAQPRIATVDIYLPLEKRTSPVGGNRHDDLRDGGAMGVARPGFSDREDRHGAFAAPAQKIHWGQLAVAAGIVVIVLSILFKLAH
jgi:hypothetical protein